MDRQSEVKRILNMGTDWFRKFSLVSINICLSYRNIKAARTDTSRSGNHGTANKRSQKWCPQKTKISCVATCWRKPWRTACPLHSLQGEGQGRVNQDKRLPNQSALEPLWTPVMPFPFLWELLRYRLNIKKNVLLGREVFHKTKTKEPF